MNIQDKIRHSVDKYDLTYEQLAILWGVPYSTLRKWLDGVRTPGRAVYRTIEILDLLEIVAPAIFKSFLTEVTNHDKKSE